MRALKVCSRFAAAAALGWSALSGSTSDAAIIYDFGTSEIGYSGITGTNYTLDPGESVTLFVFLRETLVDDTSFLADEDGLSSGAALIERVGALPTDPAVITAVARDLSNFSQFSSDSVEAGGAEATVGGVRSFDATSGTPILTINDNERRVAIGTVTIQAGDVLSEVTTFQTGDPGGDDTVTWENLVTLDDDIVPGEFTVSVVPEPVGLGLLAGAGLLLLGRRRRQQA
jgi:hypothetical protein